MTFYAADEEEIKKHENVEAINRGLYSVISVQINLKNAVTNSPLNGNLQMS